MQRFMPARPVAVTAWS